MKFKKGELGGADEKFEYVPYLSLNTHDQERCGWTYPKMKYIQPDDYYYPVDENGRLVGTVRRWISQELATELKNKGICKEVHNE